jgi:PPOX class probable F420-dependent enzyme
VDTLTPEVGALIEGRNFVHVATVMPDGSPHVSPVWAAVEDGRIAFFTQSTNVKARNLDRDPRVALSVVDHDNPYRSAHVRGRVVEKRTGEAALEVMDRISLRFTGQPFPFRGPNGVLYVIEPQRVSFVELPFTYD